jgi:hypothetical protein
MLVLFRQNTATPDSYFCTDLTGILIKYLDIDGSAMLPSNLSLHQRICNWLTQSYDFSTTLSMSHGFHIKSAFQLKSAFHLNYSAVSSHNPVMCLIHSIFFTQSYNVFQPQCSFFKQSYNVSQSQCIFFIQSYNVSQLQCLFFTVI